MIPKVFIDIIKKSFKNTANMVTCIKAKKIQNYFGNVYTGENTHNENLKIFT